MFSLSSLKYSTFRVCTDTAAVFDVGRPKVDDADVIIVDENCAPGPPKNALNRLQQLYFEWTELIPEINLLGMEDRVRHCVSCGENRASRAKSVGICPDFFRFLSLFFNFSKIFEFFGFLMKFSQCFTLTYLDFLKVFLKFS